MNHLAIARILREEMNRRFTSEDYELAGMAAPKEFLRGRAFFPGGNGYWSGVSGDYFSQPPESCHPKVLVVGNDLDSVASFSGSVKNGFEGDEGTWRGVAAMAGLLGFSVSSCFFTNSIMGLKPGTRSMGRSSGSRRSDFRVKCAEFLAIQVATVRPNLVLLLGRFTPAVFGLSFPFLKGLTKCKDFSSLDESGHCVGWFDFPVQGINQRAGYAVLTHPSMWNANVWRRRYRGKSGEEAERLMIQDAAEFAVACT